MSRGWAMLGCCLLAALSGPPGARGQVPEPRVLERPAALEAALEHFDAGRWEEAAASFEQAAREGAVPLPTAALRRWGIAAAEAGQPLAAYVRLRQYLALEPEAPDRGGLEARALQAREAVLAGAARFSRVLATIERHPDEASPGERHLVRLAARDREVSVEGLSGARVSAPLWRRAEEIALGPYTDLWRRLLDAPAVLEDFAPQRFDPNEAPRRAVVLRLVVGDEERRLEALRGDAYARVADVSRWVIDFARAAPAAADPEPRPPSRPGRRRR